MKMNKDDLIDDLQTRFGIIINSPDNPLELAENIAGYCKTLFDNDQTTKIINEYSQTASKEYEKYFFAYCDFIVILNTYTTFIRELSNPSIVLSVEIPKKQEEHEPVSLINFKEELKSLKIIRTELVNSLDEVVNNKLSNYASQLHSAYWSTLEQERLFGTLCDIETWGAFYELITIYQTIIRDWDFNFLERRYFDLQGSYHTEVEELTNKKIDKSTLLNKVRLIPKLTLVHNLLIRKIQLSDESVAETIKNQTPPNDWQLLKNDEDDSVCIYYKKTNMFRFPRNDSDKCKYFSTLWSQYGNKVSYRELYESTGLKDYPQKGNRNKLNGRIRDSLRKLRNEFNSEKLPIHLAEKKGWSVVVAQ